MPVWTHCIYFLLSWSHHSPFLIFQSSVVDIHVGHPLFYSVLILIPFAVSWVISHSLPISFTESFLATRLSTVMDCPAHWYTPCTALDTSIIGVSISNSSTNSWSVRITTSLGVTPAISYNICAIALPVNPPIGNSLPLACVTLNKRTNWLFSLVSPGITLFPLNLDLFTHIISLGHHWPLDLFYTFLYSFSKSLNWINLKLHHKGHNGTTDPLTIYFIHKYY